MADDYFSQAQSEWDKRQKAQMQQQQAPSFDAPPAAAATPDFGAPPPRPSLSADPTQLEAGRAAQAQWDQQYGGATAAQTTPGGMPAFGAPSGTGAPTKPSWDMTPTIGANWTQAQEDRYQQLEQGRRAQNVGYGGGASGNFYLGASRQAREASGHQGPGGLTPEEQQKYDAKMREIYKDAGQYMPGESPEEKEYQDLQLKRAQNTPGARVQWGGGGPQMYNALQGYGEQAGPSGQQSFNPAQQVWLGDGAAGNGPPGYQWGGGGTMAQGQVWLGGGGGAPAQQPYLNAMQNMGGQAPAWGQNQGIVTAPQGAGGPVSDQSRMNASYAMGGAPGTVNQQLGATTNAMGAPPQQGQAPAFGAPPQQGQAPQFGAVTSDSGIPGFQLPGTDAAMAALRQMQMGGVTGMTQLGQQDPYAQMAQMQQALYQSASEPINRAAQQQQQAMLESQFGRGMGLSSQTGGMAYELARAQNDALAQAGLQSQIGAGAEMRARQQAQMGLYGNMMGAGLTGLQGEANVALTNQQQLAAAQQFQQGLTFTGEQNAAARQLQQQLQESAQQFTGGQNELNRQQAMTLANQQLAGQKELAQMGFTNQGQLLQQQLAAQQALQQGQFGFTGQENALNRAFQQQMQASGYEFQGQQLEKQLQASMQLGQMNFQNQQALQGAQLSAQSQNLQAQLANALQMQQGQFAFTGQQNEAARQAAASQFAQQLGLTQQQMAQQFQEWQGGQQFSQQQLAQQQSQFQAQLEQQRQMLLASLGMQGGTAAIGGLMPFLAGILGINLPGQSQNTGGGT